MNSPAPVAHSQQLARLRQAIGRLEQRNRKMLGLLFSDENLRAADEDVARRPGRPVVSLGPTRQCWQDRRRGMWAEARDEVVVRAG